VSSYNTQDTRVSKYLDYLKKKYNKLTGRIESELDSTVVHKTIYDNTDEDKPHSLRRSERLSWILRCKLKLSSLYKSRGALLEAYYTTRDTLHQISQLSMPIGTSLDTPKNFTDKKFTIPEELGGGKAAAPPKEDKKVVDNKKDKGKAKEEPEETEEEEKLMLSEDLRIWGELNQGKTFKSELPGAYLWALTKYELIDILFKQSRYDETATAIVNAKQECEELSDTYFIRLYYQMLSMIRVHQGQVEEGVQLFENIRTYSQKYSQDDIKLAEYFGNFGEFLSTHQPERAIEVFKESRVIFWVNLTARGLKVINVQDYIDIEKGSVKQSKIPDGTPVKPVAPPVEEKKDQKAKGKPDAKGEPPVEQDYTKIEKVIKFDKEMNHELFAIDSKEATKLNKLDNIYLLNLDQLIKANLRFVQACCTIDNKYDLCIKVLIDTIKIQER
jgi:hypothetical protein